MAATSLNISATSLNITVETLKKFELQDEVNCELLGRLFETCLKLCDEIEKSDLESNNPQIQEATKTCIQTLERCTHMVNELALFSSNEDLEEIQTSSMKYLMLPALLGNLNLNLQTKELPQRLEFLEKAEIYFKDFLFRCKNYEISQHKLISSYENELLEKDDSALERKPSVVDLAATRERKIQQYKLKKELKDREKKLKPALEREDAEEYIREYYLVILERWILTAVEELSNIKSEKSCLGSIISKKDSSQAVPNKRSETKPLKPIIITRNEIQKTVFGLGYPSIPVLTIEDFYRQRFEKMVKEHKNNSEKSLQNIAMTGEVPSKEDEEVQKEILLDKDDIEALQKARAWDEWKDDNPRGSGNRKNKG